MKKEKKKRLHRIAERVKRRKAERIVDTVEGKLTVTPTGFGFVALPADEAGRHPDDIFIPPQFVGEAMDGDEVKVAILPPREDVPGDSRGPAGKIVAVLKRAREEFVGELQEGGRIKPLNRRMPDDIEITGSRRGAKPGDWVKVRLLGSEGGSWQGAITDAMGKAGEIAADLDAVMAEFDLCPRYSEADNEEALKIVPREIEREDCTKQLTVTLDPIDAKDFDDALSIMPGEKRTEVIVGVHISDVAAFIAPKSKFDKEAEKRSFSCYLPGRTLPMLPAALTARISLQAGQVSNAHTVFLTVERSSGKILSFRRAHTKIKVDHRLNYEEVQEFIDHGTAPADWSKNLQSKLKQLVEITRKMQAYRKKTEDFIDLALPEVRILCDEKTNRIVGLVSKVPRESENVVEECMLAANSAVGTQLGEISVAGLYRVHPEPEAEKIEEFTANMQEMFGITPGDLSSRKACNAFLKSLPDDPKRPIILSQLLRSLPRAYYLEKPALHFGLGKGRYCHFTSPIRRYPDLIVHQQLWNYDTGARTRSTATLAKVALDCSTKEENNDNAYFAANDRLKLRFLQEKLEAGGDLTFDGVIAKVTPAGLQLDVSELGIYGFIPNEQLKGSSYKNEHARRREAESVEWKPGKTMRVRLASIDFVRGSAVFVPAGR